MKKVVIFSSSEGNNVLNLLEYFKEHPEIRVEMVISDRIHSKSLDKAAQNGVKTLCFDYFKEGFPENLPYLLKSQKTDLIILAGYYTLLPAEMIQVFRKKIINIHPTLLPFLGGKGNYGIKLIEKTLKSGVNKTGISIHYADEKYDTGEILFQAECTISADESIKSLSNKIKKLEFEYYPKVIEEVLLKRAEFVLK